MKTHASQNDGRNHEADFEYLTQLKMKLAKKRETLILENERFGKTPALKRPTLTNLKPC